MSKPRNHDETPENEAPAAADERKVVEEAGGASLLPMDEQLRLWWEANQKSVFFAAAVVLGLIVVWQGFQLYRRGYERNIQDSFSQLDSESARLEFARQYSSHNLGGLAFLTLADAAYSEGDFESAARHYQDAVSAMDPSPIRDRASLGAAMSMLKTGNRADALARLESLASNNQASSAARAEAAFHRAILALEDKDPATFERYAEAITTFPYAQGWSSRLESFQSEAERMKGAETPGD